MNYPNLLSPLDLGVTTLRNRVVRAQAVGSAGRADHADPRAARARSPSTATLRWRAGSEARQDQRLGTPGTTESQRVQQLSGVNYERIRDAGLHISFGRKRERPQLLEVDNVVVCAGQEPVRNLEDELRRDGVSLHIIGGAAMTVELDAKRAIRQGTELAARL